MILLGNGGSNKPALIAPDLHERVLTNASNEQEVDHAPVAQLFDPFSAATWLITEMMPKAPDILFRLCDMGMREPADLPRLPEFAGAYADLQARYIGETGRFRLLQSYVRKLQGNGGKSPRQAVLRGEKRKD